MNLSQVSANVSEKMASKLTEILAQCIEEAIDVAMQAGDDGLDSSTAKFLGRAHGKSLLSDRLEEWQAELQKGL